MPDIPLLLFAKAPIPGRVKTRLQTNCSAQQAADIACILLEESIKTATNHWPGSVHLSVWLDSDHAFLRKMLSQYPISLTHQCEGDLGAKMHDGLQRFGYPAAVMGCDAPHTSASTLGEAYRSLSAGQSVIGPCDDGGYYFLGLTQTAPALFESMPWGTSDVFSKTLETAVTSQLELERLASLDDVDNWPTLLAVREKFPALSRYLLDQQL